MIRVWNPRRVESEKIHMADTKTPLQADYSYHIYNHAVGNELLFKTEENYSFFLNRLKKYLSPYVDIYAFCLIPNHFHLIIRIKNLSST